ncbi:MAG TPA: alanine racemase, partial [Candidimonas sp.]|nr:alanine racemase [Candidimonas sp.]
VTQGLPGKVSVCNSAATLTPGLWASLPDHQEQWVRPGICLYGASPFADQSADALCLRPAMTLSAKLISVRNIPAGEGIGYGHTFTSTEPMRIGVVSCGYADGYPRHAATGTPITVAGVRTRLLGRVSMDMLAVDLTSVPLAHVGSPVVLWGEGGPSVDEVAQAAGTIGYELLCAVAPRVPKIVT